MPGGGGPAPEAGEVRRPGRAACPWGSTEGRAAPTNSHLAGKRRHRPAPPQETGQAQTRAPRSSRRGKRPAGPLPARSSPAAGVRAAPPPPQQSPGAGGRCSPDGSRSGRVRRPGGGARRRGLGRGRRPAGGSRRCRAKRWQAWPGGGLWEAEGLVCGRRPCPTLPTQGKAMPFLGG